MRRNWKERMAPIRPVAKAKVAEIFRFLREAPAGQLWKRFRSDLDAWSWRLGSIASYWPRERRGGRTRVLECLQPLSEMNRRCCLFLLMLATAGGLVSRA